MLRSRDSGAERTPGGFLSARPGVAFRVSENLAGPSAGHASIWTRRETRPTQNTDAASTSKSKYGHQLHSLSDQDYNRIVNQLFDELTACDKA